MLLQRAMRYYRIWIYTCNAVLLLGVLVFLASAGCVLADVRAGFFPVPLYHPTLLYGYFALALQTGVLQLVGCVGALRLNERWLNAYWLILLLLLMGDVIMGVVWAILLAGIQRTLAADLLARLHGNYGSDQRFTAAWDRLQQEKHCCGVYGARDFLNTSKWADVEELVTNSTTVVEGERQPGNVVGGVLVRVPNSCCTEDVPREDETGANGSFCVAWTESLELFRTTWVQSMDLVPTTWSRVDKDGVFRGCGNKIKEWVQHGADLLFVIGYCVIAFLKLCFLGILRYEIKEMISKIKILHGDMPAYPELLTLGINSHATAAAAAHAAATVTAANMNSCNFSTTVPLLPEKSASHPNHLNCLLSNHHQNHTQNHNYHRNSVDVDGLGVGVGVGRHAYYKKGSNGNNNDLELLEMAYNEHR